MASFPTTVMSLKNGIAASDGLLAALISFQNTEELTDAYCTRERQEHVQHEDCSNCTASTVTLDSFKALVEKPSSVTRQVIDSLAIDIVL